MLNPRNYIQFESHLKWKQKLRSGTVIVWHRTISHSEKKVQLLFTMRLLKKRNLDILDLDLNKPKISSGFQNFFWIRKTHFASVKFHFLSTQREKNMLVLCIYKQFITNRKYFKLGFFFPLWEFYLHMKKKIRFSTVCSLRSENNTHTQTQITFCCWTCIKNDTKSDIYFIYFLFHRVELSAKPIKIGTYFYYFTSQFWFIFLTKSAQYSHIFYSTSISWFSFYPFVLCFRQQFFFHLGFLSSFCWNIGNGLNNRIGAQTIPFKTCVDFINTKS